MKKFLAGLLYWALAAQMALASTATFTWDVPPVPVDSYKLYQAPAPGQYGAPVATIPAPATSYVFTFPDVTVTTTYYFVLTAVGAGLESGPSNEVNKVYTVVVQPPLAAPSPFVVTPTSSKTTFSWPAVPGATGYLVRVHKAGTPYSPCDAMAYCNSVLLTDNSLVLTLPAGDYDAWVHAATSPSVFGPSQGAAFTVPAAPVAPMPPSHLSVK